MINQKHLKHFGKKKLGMFDSHKGMQFRNSLASSIMNEVMTAVIAPWGSGKTMLIRQLKKQVHNQGQPVNFVHVQSLDEQKVKIATILNAIIQDLAPNEGKRRDMEARSRQAIRILGSKLVNSGKHTCIIIEDAHRLHTNTLNSIRLMRELDFAGKAPLFSVILIGWPEFEDKIKPGQNGKGGRPDIYNRISWQHLTADEGWFKLPDRVKFISDVFGSIVEKSTRKRIAGFCTTPGEVMAYMAKVMKLAYEAGYQKIDEQIVQPSLKELYESLNRQQSDVSLSDIAELAGIAKSTVHLAINSDEDIPSSSKVRKAILKLLLDGETGQSEIRRSA